ncbi:MAG: lipid A deacylase LpxR family protein [Myxococcaceae bacterium]|nr:lipid A deacylase LpxR family protein [Myxococcaceae bacterium]
MRGGPSVLSGAEDLRVEYRGDNDLFAFVGRPNGMENDRWYTNGSKLSARWAIDPQTLGLGPQSRLFLSASLGQLIYTPRSTSIQSPQELDGDRPNTGWLGLSFGADAVIRQAPLTVVGRENGHSRFGAELFAGAGGPWSFAGWTQATVHHMADGLTGHHGSFPSPQGWDHTQTQPYAAMDLSAFAETSLFALRARRTVAGAAPSLQLLTAVRADAGGSLDAGALNATLVGGWTGDPVDPERVGVPFAAFLFARAEGRAVAWNASIDRPVRGARRSRHEPWVGEFSAGVVFRLWHVELEFSQLYRSNETATLPRAFQTGQWIGDVAVAITFWSPAASPPHDAAGAPGSRSSGALAPAAARRR